MRNREVYESKAARAWVTGRYGVDESEPLANQNQTKTVHEEAVEIIKSKTTNTFDFSRGRKVNVSDIKRGAIDMNA